MVDCSSASKDGVAIIGLLHNNNLLGSVAGEPPLCSNKAYSLPGPLPQPAPAFDVGKFPSGRGVRLTLTHYLTIGDAAFTCGS